MTTYSKFAFLGIAVLRSVGIGIALAATVASASAAPIWQETGDVSSLLDNNYTYTGDSTTRTGSVVFNNQIAYNYGTSARQIGMYIAWPWSYQSAQSGPGVPLLWDNNSQTFVGDGISMTVKRLDVTPLQYLRLSDVVDDTWIGNPWTPNSPGFTEPAIATQGSWEVPFFDFGVVAAGGSASYGIQLDLTFDDQGKFDEWDRAGSFYVIGQGVQAVPEPGSVALVGLALLAAFTARRRSMSRRDQA